MTVQQPENVLWLYAPVSQLNDATSYYIETIGLALSRLGVRLAHVPRIEHVPVRANLLTLECKSAFVAMLRRPRSRVWLWLQGIMPEEIEFEKRGRIRKAYWTLFERIAIPRARGLFMVSEAMREHYSRKYHLSDRPVLIMPCFNQAIDSSAFSTPNKYNRRSFVYAGNMQRWQCFDATLQTFAAIRRLLPDAQMTILTGQQDDARACAEALGVTDLTYGYVQSRELQSALRAFKYGFVLREHHPVNAVATPTKVSSYMSAGVIPIMTTAVRYYTRCLANIDPLIMVDTIDAEAIAARIVAFEHQSVDPMTILASYQRVFARCFDRKLYLDRIEAFFLSTGLRIKA